MMTKASCLLEAQIISFVSKFKKGKGQTGLTDPGVTSGAGGGNRTRDLWITSPAARLLPTPAQVSYRGLANDGVLSGLWSTLVSRGSTVRDGEACSARRRLRRRRQLLIEAIFLSIVIAHRFLL